VQTSAITALGRLATPEAKAALRAAVGQLDLLWCVVTALVEAKDHDAAPLLQAQYEKLKGHSSALPSLLDAIIQLDPELAPPLILASLRDPESDDIYTAIRGAKTLKLKEAIPLLEKLLAGKSEGVHHSAREALEALCKIPE
jgi:hypothetical protein